MEYRIATQNDINNIVEIFNEGFYKDIIASLGGLPPNNLFQTIFRFFIAAENNGFIVAVDKETVTGFIFIPTNLNRVWLKALYKGYIFVFAFQLLRWEGLKYKMVKNLVIDKFSFLSSFKKEFKTEAQVLTIAVQKKYQGTGIAKHLIKYGLEYLNSQKVKKVRLEVRPWNLAAKAVYEKMGFEYLGCTKDSNGEWLVMIKNWLFAILSG